MGGVDRHAKDEVRMDVGESDIVSFGGSCWVSFLNPTYHYNETSKPTGG